MHITAKELADKITNTSVIKKPFKHFYIDNFLPNYLLHECLDDFPDTTWDKWDKSDDDVEVKYRSNIKSEFDLPESLGQVAHMLNSADILYALSNKLDIPKLVPDPYFTGGGLNYMEKGGKLDIHVDGNYHDATGLNRRVNAILFLGGKGNLGLYDKELVSEIEPLENRLFVFDTDDSSLHGICTPVESRKSLILYYYTLAPRKNVKWDKPHSALWMGHKLTDKNWRTEREYK